MFNETYYIVIKLKITKTEIDHMRCLNVHDLNITSVIRLSYFSIFVKQSLISANLMPFS